MLSLHVPWDFILLIMNSRRPGCFPSAFDFFEEGELELLDISTGDWCWLGGEGDGWR